MKAPCKHIENVLAAVRDNGVSVSADTSCDVGLVIKCKVCKDPKLPANGLLMKTERLP